MKKLPIKWKVQEPSTGRYRSFYPRGWPDAHYKNKDESPCASIYCKDEYYPNIAKSGEHAELEIRIADHSVLPTWEWKKLKRRAATLTEAKEIVNEFLQRFPHYMPKEFQDEKIS